MLCGYYVSSVIIFSHPDIMVAQDGDINVAQYRTKHKSVYPPTSNQRDRCTRGARSEALRSVRLLLRGVSGVDFYDCWYLTFTMRLIWHLRTVSITHPSRLTILDNLEVPQLRLSWGTRSIFGTPMLLR